MEINLGGGERGKEVLEKEEIILQRKRFIPRINDE